MWPDKVVQAILDIPLGQSDVRCWMDKPAGNCRYKSLFKYLQPRNYGPAFPWRDVWKLNVLHKLQFFAWRVLLDTLPTRAQLARWDSSISPLCLICRVGDETINHLLIRCPFARSLWAFFPDSILRPASAGSITQWFWHDASDNNRRLGI